MNEQPAIAGHHEQDALTPREWLNWLVGSLSILLATQWPLAIQRLQQLTGRSLPQLPAGIHAGQIPKLDLWDLDQPLLMLGPDDPFTLRMAYENIFCSGSVGSGKSSGTLANFGRAMLAQGFGMLILTSTPGEAEEWRGWVQETGREDDFIVIEPYGDDPHQFNILDYESKIHGSGGFLSENLVELMTKINSIIEGGRKQTGNNKDFFQSAMKELLRASLSALVIGGYDVTLDNVRRMIAEAPKNIMDLKPTEDGSKNAWQKKSFCAAVLDRAIINAADGTRQEQHDVDMAVRYWASEYVHMHEKTRSSITATVTGNIDVLMYGMAHHMLATETTITPDTILEDGKVVLLNVPVNQFNETAIVIQGIWLYALQRAALRRDVTRYPFGCAIVADEAHHHLSDFTETFMATARKHRISNLYLTQNYSQLIDRLGSVDKADSLLGNFSTRIAHSQSDSRTNQMFADLVGKHWAFVSGYSTSQNTANPDQTTTGSGSKQLVYKVDPVEMTTLKKGGPPDFEVDGIIFQGGRIFKATNDTFMPITFQQIF